jgi:hypothetical protein
MVTRLLAIAATAFLAGCATAGGLTNVVVERAPGPRSSTPTYTLAISGDGLVRYEGHAHVKIAGMAEGSISPADWRLLELAVEGADFFALEDYYGNKSPGCTSTWNHHPTINITVTRGSESKRVSYYTGCWGLREGKLISWLADTADMVARSEQWVHESFEDAL